jgi:DNA ligase-1
LLREEFYTRRELLRTHFRAMPQRFMFATGMDGTDEEQIQAFLMQAVEHNCEGLMVKTLRQESTYEAAKRSNKWLKVWLLRFETRATLTCTHRSRRTTWTG